MKFSALFLLFISSATFACDVKELRKDVFNHFKKELPLMDQLGERAGQTTLKEISLTDSMMRVRGEDFFMTKLVFNILWANGVKEEKEVLMAAVIDMASCRLENFESGDVLGSSLSQK